MVSEPKSGIEDAMGRLLEARETGDVDAALDAVFDAMASVMGIPPISQQMREIARDA